MTAKQNPSLAAPQLTPDDILGPDNELTNQSEWKQWLGDKAGLFRGNIDHAALLLAALDKGKLSAFPTLDLQFERRNLQLMLPRTALLLRDEVASGPVGELGGLLILVKKSYLERTSLLNMQEICTVLDANGNVILRCYPSDMLHLGGIETIFDAANEQAKTAGFVLRTQKDDLSDLSLEPVDAARAESDAQALRYAVAYRQWGDARLRRMPKLTIDALKQRVTELRSARPGQN